MLVMFHCVALCDASEISFSSVSDYVELLQTIFDFPALRQYVADSKLKILIDCMHGGLQGSLLCAF
jgi:hypothetical protein